MKYFSICLKDLPTRQWMYLLKWLCWILYQGLLKIWTEHSHWFSPSLKPFEISLWKFQGFYNLSRYQFSPNFKGIAQKLGPPHPFEVLDVFGGKFKYEAPRTFISSAKRVPIEVNNWWKFGVNISNHLWDIQNWKFFFLEVPPTRYKNNFQKLFLYQLGRELKEKNVQISISQKWFEISTPNFHQLLTSIGTHFVPNLKALGALDLDFPPKTSKTSNGRDGPNFWATPFKFGENSFLS